MGFKARSITSATPIEQPFRFQGQQFDEETGLNYNRFRYYDLGFNSSTITPTPGNR
nr:MULTISPECIES: RHS repeat-associated core domain-containing protein [unclassified Delftia]